MNRTRSSWEEILGTLVWALHAAPDLHKIMRMAYHVWARYTQCWQESVLGQYFVTKQGSLMSLQRPKRQNPLTAYASCPGLGAGSLCPAGTFPFSISLSAKQVREKFLCKKGQSFSFGLWERSTKNNRQPIVSSIRLLTRTHGNPPRNFDKPAVMKCAKDKAVLNTLFDQ